MASKEQILRARNPLDLGHGSAVDNALGGGQWRVILEGIETYILVQARVSLRDRLPPDDLSCREPHNNVDMCGALGD